MRSRYERFIAIAFFYIACGACLFAGAANEPWQSGRVISATLGGHGPADEGKWRAAHRVDIWWIYCIAGEDQVYSVISRESPKKTGLKNNSLTRYFEKKNQIYVVNPAGKRIALRILRKDKTGKCP